MAVSSSLRIKSTLFRDAVLAIMRGGLAGSRDEKSAIPRRRPFQWLRAENPKDSEIKAVCDRNHRMAIVYFLNQHLATRKNTGMNSNFQKRKQTY